MEKKEIRKKGEDEPIMCVGECESRRVSARARFPNVSGSRNAVEISTVEIVKVIISDKSCGLIARHVVLIIRSHLRFKVGAEKA